ncbi:MAG: hypothetical protein KBF73_08400 [Flavobacteriales bacterium]|nr:hypothetical protein [Flavobacteriales bacterium]
MEYGNYPTSRCCSKQWDKDIKGLASHGLTKVTKTAAGLTVEAVGR